MRRWIVLGLMAGGALAAVLFCRRTDVRLPAERAVREATIELANRVVVARGFPEGSSTNQSPTARGTLPYVVACAVPADKTLRRAVEAAGSRVIGFFPPESFQIEADGEALRKLSADARFAAATEFLPEDKIDERLSAALRGGTETVEAAVVALASEDRDAVRTWVTSRGGELLKGCLDGADSFRARLPAALVEDLARRGDVRWLELFDRPQLLNDMAVESAAMNVRETWNTHGLSGKNQVVSTSDSGIDTGDVATMHRDLADRVCGIGVVENCTTNDVNGHGTHTAGSIVGNGAMSDGAIRGTAWGAKLWAWFCGGADGKIYMPADCEELFRPDQTNWPAFIHSASWGNDTAGKYDSQCMTIDQYVWEHPDFLPVFANGNAGSDDGTVGSPAAAKNVLAVGATQNARSGNFRGWPSGSPSVTAGYSSRGPCQDGRIKPDVAAPGTGVLSTRAYGCSYTFGIGSNTNYAYNCGTSMATPLTAGAVALVREWLVDHCGFTNEPPTAALMKAVITGGAKGVSLPNNEQGWGCVDLEETLFPSNRAVKLVDRIPFAVGTNFTYLIETTNAAPLDVQLVWIDAPGSVGGWQSSPRLVNNLDLSVEALDESELKVWYGNGGDSPDAKNTVESVRLGTASATTYKIVVSCSRIRQDHTDGGAAALYIRGAFDPAAVPSPPESVSVTVAVEASGATAEVSPAAGTTQVLKGQRIDFAAPEWACEYSSQGTPFSRRAYRGFEGTGDAPAAGSEREFSVVVSNETTVVWKYEPEVAYYRFSYFAYLYNVGYDCFRDEWLPNGTNFTFRFPEDAACGDPYVYRNREYRLGTVFYAQTDGEEGQYLVRADNGRLWDSVEITMDEGVDLWCYYFKTTEKTTDGLPYWWYMRYLWGGESFLDYDGSATGDPDGDGFKNAAEYADSTDPVDDASFRLKIDAFSPTSMSFTGSIKGNLIVERCDRLGGEWKGVLTNFPPRESTVNAVSLAGQASSNGFYRVIYR